MISCSVLAFGIAEVPFIGFKDSFIGLTSVPPLGIGADFLSIFVLNIPKIFFNIAIEYEIIGEGSQILTNQKRESTVFSLLISRNLRPFPDNFVLYFCLRKFQSCTAL